MGGGDFVIEIAEMNPFGVQLYRRNPFIKTPVIKDAFVFRGFAERWPRVEVVLANSAIAEIGLSIIERVAINVVADKMRRGLCDETMHKDFVRFAILPDGSDGIFCSGIGKTVPAETGKTNVVIGVKFGEPALRKRQETKRAKRVIFEGQNGDETASENITNRRRRINISN
jgi:hypothetical protein